MGRPRMSSTLGLGARLPRNLRLAELGLGMHEWLGIVEPDAPNASERHVERRCSCDAPDAECAWTQQGYAWLARRRNTACTSTRDASEATNPSEAVGSGTVRLSQPWFELGPLRLRCTTPPETSEIAPTPFTRASEPVSMNTWGPSGFVVTDTVIIPVVQGAP